MFSPDLDKMMPHIPPSYEDKQRLMKANGGRYQISAVTKCGNEVQEGRWEGSGEWEGSERGGRGEEGEGKACGL